jgi:hypothetical protein
MQPLQNPPFCSNTIITREEYTLGTVPAETTVRNTQTSRGRISSRDFIVLFSFNSRRNLHYICILTLTLKLSKGDFWSFSFHVGYSTLLHLPPLADSTVSENAGIEPRTVATLALKASLSNHSAGSHPQPLKFKITFR